MPNNKVGDVEKLKEINGDPENILEDTDAIFEQIGQFGCYQLAIFLIICLVAIIPALTAYSFVFNGATPEHRCKLPNYANDTFEIQSDEHRRLIDYYIPEKDAKKGVTNRYDGCHIKYYSNESSLSSNGSSSNFSLNSCNEWVYSKEFYQTTIVAKVI